MNALLDEFDDAVCPLKIYGAPCNQFGLQEPGVGIEIVHTIEYVRPGHGFKPKLDLLAKRDVNGKNEDELFAWLKSLCPNPSTMIGDPSGFYFSPIRTTDITWNFAKFLIDHRGRPKKRYEPSFKPLDMKKDIQELMDECKQARKHEGISRDIFQIDV